MNKKHSFVVSLGGVTISIQSDKKLFIELAKYGFKGYVSLDKDPGITVNVIIDDLRDSNTYSYGRPHHISVIFESGKFFLRGSSYSGTFDINSLKGEVRQSIAIAPLYLFLRFVLSVYLPLLDGFIMHSNSILKDDECFLFSGKPQSGKSTVAKLSNEYKILSDDFSIIRRMSESFKAYGSPFWGHVEVKGENIKNKNGYVDIKGIYFLNKDTSVYVHRLDKKEAVLKVIENMAILAKSRDINTRLIRLADEFTDNVSVGRLHFRPDKSFWRDIENDRNVRITESGNSL